MAEPQGGFDAALKLEESALEDLLQANELLRDAAVMSADINERMPIPAIFEGTVASENVRFVRNRIARASTTNFSYVGKDPERQAHWINAYTGGLGKTITGRNSVSLVIDGTASAPNLGTVNFSAVLSFFFRQVRATELGPSGKPTLRVTRTGGLPQFPVRDTPAGQTDDGTDRRFLRGPVSFGIDSLPGDIVRMRNAEGFYMGAPMPGEAGAQIQDKDGVTYTVIIDSAGRALLQAPSGENVAE